MKYIPASGNPNARILVLGEAPSYAEVEAGRPFIGPSGKELDRLLFDVGIKRESLWVSNVSKYMVPPNVGAKKIPFHVRASNAGIDIDKEIQDLQNEINQVRPNVILALGGSALWATTGSYKIGDYRGSILYGMGRKVIPTYHPAHLLHMAVGGEFKGYWNRQVMILDMKRAIAQAEFPEVRRPSRNLNICRSSSQLQDFLHRYRNFKRPAVDIEARGSCLPFCIGLAFTPYEGLTVPLWNKGEIEDVVRINDSDMVNMWILLARALYTDVVGQNFKYDQDKIARLGFIISRLGSDTLLKSFTISPELPKNLAFNTSIRTEEPFYKNEGMYEGELKNLLIGCARDACVTKEIDLSMDADIDELGLRQFYENFVLKLHDLYLGIENEGFHINKEAKERLLEKYVAWSERLSYELFTLTDGYYNVNSPKQIYTLLFEVLQMPKRYGVGEEELTALLNNQGKTGVHTPEGRRILEIILEKRRVDKTIGNYLMAMPDYDGKMKTSYFLCLETGRTSTHQLEPPIRPSIEYRDSENKKKKKAIGTAFQTMTKHGDIGEDVRSIYIPEPGYVFLQADSAQAEARVVFKLADDEQALKDIDTHDYHALTASWFFGGVEDDYSKRKLGYESPIRFAGKTLRHAGHLGAGKRRAATSVNTDARKYKIPIQITEQIAERALKIFHLKQPKIQGVFQKGVVHALERDKRYITAAIPFGIDSKFGGKRLFFERWGEELFRQAFSYIPQRSISDNTKAAALRLVKNETRAFKEGLIKIIMESHDALLFSILENRVEEFAPLIKEEMERPISFETCSLPRSPLIVPCELEIGYNYQELKKFKQ